jgi:hypothetical protein
MLSVTSAVAIGLVVLGWVFKYGLGFDDDSRAALKRLRSLDSHLAGAVFGTLRAVGCLYLWYSDSSADGPVISTAMLSIMALVEFSSIQKQGPLAAASSAAAVLLACKASYKGSAPQSIPLLLILVSVNSLTIY